MRLLEGDRCEARDLSLRGSWNVCKEVAIDLPCRYEFENRTKTVTQREVAPGTLSQSKCNGKSKANKVVVESKSPSVAVMQGVPFGCSRGGGFCLPALVRVITPVWCGDNFSHSGCGLSSLLMGNCLSVPRELGTSDTSRFGEVGE